MSKQHIQPKTLTAAKKLIGFHAAGIEEMAHDVGKRMIADQMEWLDAQMKDVLPPELYQAGLAGDPDNLLPAYVERHGIRFVFIPDSCAIRLMLGERVHSQFVPKFLVDGEEVKVEATGFAPDPTKN